MKLWQIIPLTKTTGRYTYSITSSGCIPVLLKLLGIFCLLVWVGPKIHEIVGNTPVENHRSVYVITLLSGLVPVFMKLWENTPDENHRLVYFVTSYGLIPKFMILWEIPLMMAMYIFVTLSRCFLFFMKLWGNTPNENHRWVYSVTSPGPVLGFHEIVGNTPNKNHQW